MQPLGIHDTGRSNAMNLLMMRAIRTYKQTMLVRKTPTKPHQQGPHCPHTGFLSANTHVETILATLPTSSSAQPLSHSQQSQGSPTSSHQRSSNLHPIRRRRPLKILTKNTILRLGNTRKVCLGACRDGRNPGRQSGGGKGGLEVCVGVVLNFGLDV